MNTVGWLASPSTWTRLRRFAGLATAMAFVAFFVLDNFVLVEVRFATVGITTRLGWIIVGVAAGAFAVGRASVHASPMARNERPSDGADTRAESTDSLEKASR